jgi:two-component system cell cycle sensor histidine kinase/response regulator CckA
MPPEVKARIFEPFYSTKFCRPRPRTRRGARHRALAPRTIKVYSEAGRGTTFKLLFPALDEKAPQEPAAAGRPISAWRGAGLALVVDDEETVRAVAARTLESLGFTPLTASDGCRGSARVSRTRRRPARRAPGSHHAAHEREETFRELCRINPGCPWS